MQHTCARRWTHWSPLAAHATLQPLAYRLNTSCVLELLYALDWQCSLTCQAPQMAPAIAAIVSGRLRV